LKIGGRLQCKVRVPTRTWLQGKRIPASLYVSALSVAVSIAPPVSAQNKAIPSPLAGDGSNNQVKTNSPPADLILSRPSIFFPELATMRAPLTPEEKFRLSINKSVSPASLLISAAGAGISQATESPGSYGQEMEGYGKRFAASMTTRTTSNLFGGFAIAAIARQDPRYFVRGKGTLGQRLAYAISRVVAAPNDRGGYGFNWGGVLGPLGAEGFSNLYQPDAERTGSHTMKRYGISLAAAARGNILREFWPDIFKRFRPVK